jgi:hypothetical protein
MYQPSQQDVRRFFCEVYQRQLARLPLEPMQAKAADWVNQHPEYHRELSDLEVALQSVYSVEDGKVNPFLHLSMHLSIEEQCDINQPTGIREAVASLARKKGAMHLAHHEVMECLGDMIWRSQRSGLPPDGHAYLDAVKRRASRD